MKLRKSTIALICLTAAYFAFATICYVASADWYRTEPDATETQQQL
ncbi:MAG: hypothetical protein LBV26_08815 [Bacteroidales bacterium]|jgi:hypothetical protein|nr:hypothetical protein [Bacteroidales bacterium]